MTRQRPHRTRNDYEVAVACRLAELNLTLDHEVVQSIWLLHESTVISRRALSNAGLREQRLTWTQFEALLHLWLFGPTRMGDVAAAASVSNPTLTDVVAALDGRGYLNRVPSPTDGRATLLAITERGSVVVASLLPTFGGAVEDSANVVRHLQIEEPEATLGQGVDPADPGVIESFGTERSPHRDSDAMRHAWRQPNSPSAESIRHEPSRSEP